VLGAEAAATPARERAQDVRRCIINDIHGTPVTKRASQNLAAVAALLRAGPKLRRRPRSKRNSVSTCRRSSMRPLSSRRKVRRPDGARHGHRPWSARLTASPHVCQGSRAARKAFSRLPVTRSSLATRSCMVCTHDRKAY
jgi:hypothetical protein